MGSVEFERMSAVDRFKLELGEYPPLPGGELMPMLRAAPDSIPSNLVLLLAEIVTRLEALEAERA